MAEKNNEPQSYGSQSEWVRGDVGQEVNRLKGSPNSQHSDFYQSRQEQGSVSPEQIEDNRQPTGAGYEDDEPTQKITAEESGARRDSYFKDRDYE